jgi:hypothetical protein
MQCLDWAIDTAREEQVFSFGRDGKFIPHFLIKGVKNLVGGTLMGIRVPGSRPFPLILMPIICPHVQLDALSTVKFTGLQAP